MQHSFDRCDECGFDGGRWDRRDTINTIPGFAPLVTLSVEDAAPAMLQSRPDAQTWSIGEYLDHMASIIEVIGLGVHVARDQPGG